MKQRTVPHPATLTQAYQDFLQRKLDHYNKWLMDTKRPLSQPYPGFDEEFDMNAFDNIVAVSTGEAVVPERLKATKDQKPAKGSKSKATAKPVKAKRESAGPRAGSKLEQALALFRTYNGDRKATIAAIMSEVGMSQAGATTYFYNAKKASQA